MTSSGQNSDISDSQLHPAVTVACRLLGGAYRVGSRPVQVRQVMSISEKSINSVNTESERTASSSVQINRDPSIEVPSSSVQGIENQTEYRQENNSITIQSSNRREPISRKIGKTRSRGQRGKYLRENLINLSNTARSCPPRSLAQTEKLKYHRRVNSIFSEGGNFENSKNWKPNDLTYIVCDTSVTGKKQLKQHFKNSKHKKALWKLTPKYCAPCGIYSGFPTQQLWNAHISSRRHNSVITKIAAPRRIQNEYGFTN